MTNEDRRAKPEDRSAFTPEVRERLHAQAFGHEKTWPAEYDLFADLRIALLRLDALAAEVVWLKAANAGHKESVDALEARVAVLAAECVASRAHDACSDTGRNRAVTWSELCEARRQTDAAGALEGGRS